MSARSGRPRRAPWVLGILAVLLVLVAAAVVLAETTGRTLAEGLVEDRLEDRLPGAGDVDATIEGFPFLTQVLGGTLEQVDVVAPDLIVGGTAVDADFSAYGVPIDQSSVQRIDGTFTLSPEALDAVLQLPESSGAVTLGDGVLQYQASLDLRFTQATLDVTLTPSVEGEYLVLTATDVRADAADLGVDLSQVLEFGDFSTRICAPAVLPAVFELQGVDVTPDGVAFAIEGRDVPLSADALTATGSCE